MRTSSETNRLLLHDSCAKELARVISGLYQDNYRKFEAHVLTSGMKPNATSKFSGHCLSCALLDLGQKEGDMSQWSPWLHPWFAHSGLHNEG